MSGSVPQVGVIPITTITAAGVSVPAYIDIYAAFVAAAQQIFGSGIYVAEDSQDGQYIGVVAQAILDACNAVAAAYNAYSPNTAQGTGLSSVVKINGIARELPTNSTVDLTLTGLTTAAVTITNGVAADAIGNQWALPPSVTIPADPGYLIVTATSVQPGNVNDPPGAITTILTPTNGWLSVTNASASSPGSLLEDDAELRQRQTVSTALTAQTIFTGLYGALLGLDGVTRLNIIENDTDSTNEDGVPANATAVVVEGGTDTGIAAAIAYRKTLGAPTYGTTTEPVTDQYGNVTEINFSRPTYEQTGANITVQAGNGYTAATTESIQAAISSVMNATGIGKPIPWSQCFGNALMQSSIANGLFTIQSYTQGVVGDTFVQEDITLAWNVAAQSQPSYVNVTVT
jgi:uncharacterized phage protein gp47/JayE